MSDQKKPLVHRLLDDGIIAARDGGLTVDRAALNRLLKNADANDVRDVRDFLNDIVTATRH